MQALKQIDLMNEVLWNMRAYANNSITEQALFNRKKGIRYAIKYKNRFKNTIKGIKEEFDFASSNPGIIKLQGQYSAFRHVVVNIFDRWKYDIDDHKFEVYREKTPNKMEMYEAIVTHKILKNNGILIFDFFEDLSKLLVERQSDATKRPRIDETFFYNMIESGIADINNIKLSFKDLLQEKFIKSSPQFIQNNVLKAFSINLEDVLLSSEQPGDDSTKFKNKKGVKEVLDFLDFSYSVENKFKQKLAIIDTYLITPKEKEYLLNLRDYLSPSRYFFDLSLKYGTGVKNSQELISNYKPDMQAKIVLEYCKDPFNLSSNSAYRRLIN